MVTESERKVLEELANMDFLDEVINVMVLYTLNKTQSANINKPYIMKVANDFAYQKLRQQKRLFLRCVVSRNEIKNAKLKQKWLKLMFQNGQQKNTNMLLQLKKRQNLKSLDVAC